MADEISLEPLTREERYYNAIANGENINLKPTSRKERYLYAIANKQQTSNPSGGASIDLKSILEAVYPVGSIYITMDNRNPAETLGFGEWGPRKDVFIVGAGDNYLPNTIGGESFHTLTLDEIPAHNHSSEELNMTGNIGLADDSGSDYGFTLGYGKTSDRTDLEIQVAVNGSYEPNPINNNPPYFAAFIWQRLS